MSSCINCGSSCENEWSYVVSEVKGYKELTKKDNQSSGMYDNGKTREIKEKVVLLHNPESELTGGVCKTCLRKPRIKNYIGLAISLFVALFSVVLLGLLTLQTQASSAFLAVLFKGGIFLSLVMALIFAMPLFRNKQIEIADLFFLKVRAEKPEPVLSLQELSYYYGKKNKHWLMLRKSHWEELLQEEDYKILGF